MAVKKPHKYRVLIKVLQKDGNKPILKFKTHSFLYTYNYCIARYWDVYYMNVYDLKTEKELFRFTKNNPPR